MRDVYEGDCRVMRNADNFYLFVDLIGQTDTEELTFDLKGETETIAALAEYNDIDDPNDIGNSISVPRLTTLVKMVDGEYELAVDQMSG